MPPKPSSFTCICGWAGSRKKSANQKGLTMHQNKCQKFQEEKLAIFAEGQTVVKQTGIGDFKRQKLQNGTDIAGPNQDRSTKEAELVDQTGGEEEQHGPTAGGEGFSAGMDTDFDMNNNTCSPSPVEDPLPTHRPR
ncbi:hypothetical protein M422DRAFT_44495 [Sphaerobolus stellatus SS14]|nr:hypothetical protein M422DRAFT_44495 [Sphaerobolus stellatus SS14]